VNTPYRTPHPEETPKIPPLWVVFCRPLAWILAPFLSHLRIIRRAHGGRWERRYVEPCHSTLWLHVEEFGDRLPLEGPCEAREEHP
jgi:hypothetical protein